MLFFDIETKASDRAVEFIDVKVPANYKDPEKIEAYIEEKKAEALEKAALDPDLGEVLAIGVRQDLDGETDTFYLREDLMLEEFWELFAKHDGVVCGYNIIGFDLPFLMRRSMAYNMSIPFIPSLSKYKIHPTYDLMGILYNWNNFKSLKTVAKIYGIKNKMPDLDGSMVKDMSISQMLDYVESDVDMVVDLYKMMNGVYF